MSGSLSTSGLKERLRRKMGFRRQIVRKIGKHPGKERWKENLRKWKQSYLSQQLLALS